MNSEETKRCITCKADYPTDQFVGIRQQPVKSCISCREKMRIYDRDMRDNAARKEAARELSKNPERIATKKKWVQENRDKVDLYCKTHRAKKVVENAKEYLAHNAEVMAAWREKNADKMAELNKKRRESKFAQYNVYKRSAGLKRLAYSLTFEEYNSISDLPCYYCGSVQEKGFNGIDRVDQTRGYVLDNCVSCCERCNLMKGSVDVATFIRRILHIYSRYTNSLLYSYPECFPDCGVVRSYNTYKTRAETREWDFTLTKDEFAQLIMEPCYICGKEKNEHHMNGVDRVNNGTSYNIADCRACCRECNYMKKNIVLDEFLNWVQKIYLVWHTKELPNTPTQLCFILRNTNKKTKDELMNERDARIERKVKRAKELLENS